MADKGPASTVYKERELLLLAINPQRRNKLYIYSFKKERKRIKYVNIQPYKLLPLSDWLYQEKLGRAVSQSETKKVLARTLNNNFKPINFKERLISRRITSPIVFDSPYIEGDFLLAEFCLRGDKL